MPNERSGPETGDSDLRFQCAAFLFDMDGVLVDARAVVERTWRRWAPRHQMNPELLIRAAHGRRSIPTLLTA